jgi:hypothetical protein
MTMLYRDKWNVLAQAWRKAAGTNDYTLNLPSYQEAMNLRARLYACIRRAKKAKFADSELVAIASTYAVTVQGCKVVIYRQTLSPGLQSLEIALTKQEAGESETLLMGLLAKQGIQVEEEGSKLTAETNPYYTR